MKRFLLIVTCALVVLLGGALLAPFGDTPAPASFTELVAASANTHVSAAEFNLDTGRATITVPTGKVSGPAPRTWMEETAASLANKNIPVKTTVSEPAPLWESLLTTLLPLLLLGGLAWLLIRSQTQIGRGGRNLTESAERPTARLADVQGMPETVETMREIVDLWSADLADTGVAPMKGALLVGPPGTGKTLLARAMAGETGCRILTANGSEFTEVFAGVGAKRVRKLFETARKIAEKDGRVIVFIDEIDSIAAARPGNDMSTDSSQEQTQTLNAILHELDGFTPEDRIFLVGATNRAEVIDSALTRPGRFDRTITVGLPDAAGRANILRLYVDKQSATSLPVAAGFDVNAFAKRCPGASGADLADVVQTAARMAYLGKAAAVTAAHLSEALAEIAVGKARKSAMMEGDDLAITAWHEAGHTVAALVQDCLPDPVEVTIVPRGPAGGVTWLVERDSPYHTREQLHADMVVAFAGRAGELLRPGGAATTGASSDLESAHRVALSMVCRYGMRPNGKVGLLARDSDQAEGEVEQLLAAASSAASALLTTHRGLVERVATELLTNETVVASRLSELRAAEAALTAGQSNPLGR